MALDPTKLYYLASPYSHIDPKVQHQRFELVNEFAAKLIEEQHLTIIEPIVCGHAKLNLLPTTFTFWQDMCRRFIQHCDAVIVYTIPGWKESIGVQAEIKYAKELGKPIFFTS